MEVKSKYSWYARLFFFAVAFLMFALAAIPFTVKHNNSKPITSIKIFLMTAFIIVVIIYISYQVFHNFSVYKIQNGSIYKPSFLFNKKIIFESTIVEIDLLTIGYISTSGLWTVAATIKLQNGKKIKIADPVYRNIGEIKQALITNFPEKIKPITKEKKQSELLVLDVQRFSGSAILNFNSIVWGSLILFVLYTAITIPSYKRNELVLYFAFFFCITAFPAILFYQSYYFNIQNNCFIIKNHFLWWINKQFDLNDIVAVHFETMGRLSQGLRIVTRDYNSYFYTAGSLNTKTWNTLKRFFIDNGIYFIE